MSDNLKKETYRSLQSMGYNYIMVDLAYKRAPIKTTEGVLNYIMSNPTLQEESEDQINQHSNSYPQRSSNRTSKIDPALKGELLLMGFLEEQIDAALANPGVNNIEKAINWISDHPHLPEKKKEVKKVSKEREKKPIIPSRRNEKRISSGYSRTKEEPVRRKIDSRGQKKKIGNVDITEKKSDNSNKDTPNVEFGVYDPSRRPKIVEDSGLKIEKTKEEKEKEEKIRQEKERERLRMEMLKRAKMREIENKRNPPPKPEPQMEEIKKKTNFSKKDKGSEIHAKIAALNEKKKQEEKLGVYERQKLEKEREKKAILDQLALDKARRFGKEIEIEEEQVVTVEDHFLEIYEKMESIYPIRTPKAQKLKTCLTTIGIYLSKFPFILLKIFFLKIE